MLAMGKKRKRRTSDVDSSSEEQKRKSSEAEEEEGPSLQDGIYPKSDSLSTTKISTQQTLGNKLEGTEGETNSEIETELSFIDETDTEKELAKAITKYLRGAPINLPNETIHKMYYRRKNYVTILVKVVEALLCKRESLVKDKEALVEKREVLEKQIHQFANFDTKLEKLERVVSKVAEAQFKINRVPQKKMTFAEKLKSPGTKIAEIQKQYPRLVITVYPKENSHFKSNEDTKAALMTCMVPAKKLKIRSFKKIANNGVLIETTTKEDMTIALEIKKFNVAGLVAPAKKRPQILIYDVPTKISENDILSALMRQNLEGIDEEKVKEGIAMSHKTGKRNSDTTD